MFLSKNTYILNSEKATFLLPFLQDRKHVLFVMNENNNITQWQKSQE